MWDPGKLKGQLKGRDPEREKMRVQELVRQKEILVAKKLVKEGEARVKKMAVPFEKLSEKAVEKAKEVGKAKKAYKAIQDEANKIKEKLKMGMKEAGKVKKQMDVSKRKSKEALAFSEKLVQLRNESVTSTLKLKTTIEELKKAEDTLKTEQAAAQPVEDELAQVALTSVCNTRLDNLNCSAGKTGLRACQARRS